MPRLSNDKRKQAVGMLNAGISATVVSRHFGCTRKTIEHLRRRFRFTGNLADLPRSCRPRTTSATDDRYIILQHLCNRCLTAAATGRHMVFIHRLSEIGLDKTFNLFKPTICTSIKFSPDLIQLQGGIGTTVTCISDMLIGI